MMMSATIRLEQRRAALVSRKLAWSALFLLAMVFWHLRQSASISRDLTDSLNNEYWALPGEMEQRTRPSTIAEDNRETSHNAINRASDRGGSLHIDKAYEPLVSGD